MRYLITSCAVLIVFGVLSISSHVEDSAKVIEKEDAIQLALAELGVEILGIRFDKPDNQCNVIIRSGKQAYDIEVNAITGKIVTAEEESLEEIQAELSGDLSHQGVSGDVDK